jgi:hypothetical protein
MHHTPITVNEWRKQRAIYHAKPDNTLQLGFATFFLIVVTEPEYYLQTRLEVSNKKVKTKLMQGSKKISSM